MKKKIFLFLITVFATLMLVACGKDKETYQIIAPEDAVVRVGANFDALEGVTLVDSKGNTSTKYEVKVRPELDLSKEGDQVLTYYLDEDVTHETADRLIEVKAVVVTGIEPAEVILGDTTFSLTSGVVFDDPIRGVLYPYQAEFVEYFTVLIDGDAEGQFLTSVEKDYEITYVFKDGDYTLEKTRIISVVDKPVFYGVADARVLVKTDLFDPYYRVIPKQPLIDEETGEVTVVDIDSKYVYIDPDQLAAYDPDELGIYTLTYKIQDPEDALEFLKDKDGNEIVVTRKVEVYNEVKLFGASSKSVTKGTTDFDPRAGVRALDAYLGDITDDVEITGVDSINFDELGDYPIVYSIEGAGGVFVEVEVKISVVAEMTGKQQVIIMAGDLREVNPFHPQFSGKNQEERQAKQREVEAKYNVEVLYEAYPSNAGWGPNRVNAMIQAGLTGDYLSDLYYHITTDWLRELVQGGALASIDKYRSGAASVIHDTYYEAGEYNGQHYGFAPGALTLAEGLFFNVDLLESKNIPNPADLYNEGRWTWSNFEAWAEAAQAVLDEDHYTLGGALSYYAEHMVALNGGKLLDMVDERVAFLDDEALETYNFIHGLYNKDLFEPNRAYDAGSDEWKSGKVLVHPGDIWFVNADNRWLDLNFELGYVPYPMNDAYLAAGGEFKSPTLGVSIVTLSAGMTPEREELVFNVWVELQGWETEEELKENYEMGLVDRFNDLRYIDIMLANFDKTYTETINSIGVTSYGAGSYRTEIAGGLADGSFATRLAQILDTYEYNLRQYLKGD